MKWKNTHYWRAKTPTVIQMEAVECGAASLGIILGYHGRYVPLEQLRIDCGVSRNGSSALKVIQAAKKYHLTASGFQMDVKGLQEIKAPCILFWGFNHFLVLEGFSKKKVFLNDPGMGPRTTSYEDFEKDYTGVVITFTPLPSFQKVPRPPLLFQEIVRRLKSSSSPFIYLALTSFFLLLPGLAFPAFTRIFVDRFLTTSSSMISEVKFIGIILFSTFMAGMLTMLRQFCLKRFNAQLSIVFSSTFLWHLLRLPMAFYMQRYSGEIAFRMHSNDKVVQTITGPLASTALDMVLVGFYAAFLFLYDIGIGLLSICALLLNFSFMAWIQRSRSDAFARQQQEMGKVAGLAIGGLLQIETIKATGMETPFFSRLSGMLTRSSNALQEISKKDALLMNAPVLLQTLATAGLLALGGVKVIEGEITVGMLMALYLLLLSFLQPVSRFVNFAQMIQNTGIQLERLNDALKYPIDVRYVEEKKPPATKPKLEGMLQFRDVTFGYSAGDPPLIEGLSFDLLPGKRVALVGPSGCGKSTIARLSCALYQPWKGEILYDGLPFLKHHPDVLQNSIASVDQEILIFEGTLWDNLTLWDTTITEEMLFQATKAALLHELILTRDDLGYKAHLVEGGRNLSGGQRQLLEIARALVRRPSLLIMDEATSSLDSQTEKTISDNIRRMGCACVMIAHRLSTIQDCDEIIVLDRGKVVARGSHQELKGISGLYQELVERESAKKE